MHTRTPWSILELLSSEDETLLQEGAYMDTPNSPVMYLGCDKDQRR